MKVFVTGASGHVGSAVVPELVRAGHQVLGLARSDSSAKAVRSFGAEVQRGSLDELDVLRQAAASADAVIHLAYKHHEMNTGDFAGANDADLRAIEAMGEVLTGTDKAFIGTSGTLMLAFSDVTDVGTENDPSTKGPRAEAENAVLALANFGVRSSVVRLPPSVHSSLDHAGFVPALIAIARAKGRAGFVGDGLNRWPAVHSLDAACLYRLAMEAAPPGSRLHGISDEGVPFREVAQAIGQNLNVPTVSVKPEDAADYFGFLAFFVPVDNATSSTRTQELLGWNPVHPGLVDDINEGHYFTSAAS